MEILIQPYTSVPFGEALKSALQGDSGNFEQFFAAIAFVKSSGVLHIEAELREFCNKGGKTLIIAGIDRQGTSIEGLEGLLKLLSEHGEVFINYCTDPYVTFHPKVYFFENQDSGLLFVGSGNLTEGGLYLNDEAFLVVKLDFRQGSDRELAAQVRAVFQQWKEGNGLLANEELLQLLLQSELLITETPATADIDLEDEISNQKEQATKIRQLNPEGLFQRSLKRRIAPKRVRAVTRKTVSKGVSPAAETSDYEPFESNTALGYVMILQTTDVGTGQKTIGAGRRSPEIFIPLAARDLYPEFWGWRDLFVEDAAMPGKLDRKNVGCRIGGEIVQINMMYWPPKHEFRLRSEKLRSAGSPGDILRMEKTASETGFDYYVEIIPQNTSAYEQYLKFCSVEVRNSAKRWGYYGF